MHTGDTIGLTALSKIIDPYAIMDA
jgi:hypothetical protein